MKAKDERSERGSSHCLVEHPQVEFVRRRALLALLVAVPGSCVGNRDGPARMPIDAPARMPTARPAAIGQQWTYDVRNVFNGSIVDQIVETVIAIRPTIRIQRVSQHSGVQAEEIHEPWGMLVQDPHWRPPIVFDAFVPAWPVNLTDTGARKYQSSYHLLDDDHYRLFWRLQMTPRGWERITVRAGTYDVLHFDNQIAYASNDFYRIESERAESVWFAPEIGRWVMRRSRGMYYLPGPSSGTMFEDYLQWELISWT